MEVAASGLALGLKAHESAATQAYHLSLPVYFQLDKEKEKKNKVVLAEELVNGFCFKSSAVKELEPSERCSESSSSSIGEPSENSASEEEEEEVQSKIKEPLGSLNSLEDALPIKRGLSNFFSGKSKSFACLSDVANANVGELAKQDNPFNKRRRLIMANKNSWARRASYSSLIGATTSLRDHASPSLIVEEEKEEEEEDENEKDAGDSSSPSLPPLPNHHDRKANKALKSPRSFSLSDLQHA